MKRITIFRISFYSLAGVAALFLAYSYGTVSGHISGVVSTQASFTTNFMNATMNNLKLINEGNVDSLKNSLEAQLDLGLIIILSRQELRTPWLVSAKYVDNDEQIIADVETTLKRGANYRTMNAGQLILPGDNYHKDLVQFLQVDSVSNEY